LAPGVRCPFQHSRAGANITRGKQTLGPRLNAASSSAASRLAGGAATTLDAVAVTALWRSPGARSGRRRRAITAASRGGSRISASQVLMAS